MSNPDSFTPSPERGESVAVTPEYIHKLLELAIERKDLNLIQAVQERYANLIDRLEGKYKTSQEREQMEKSPYWRAINGRKSSEDLSEYADEPIPRSVTETIVDYMKEYVVPLFDERSEEEDAPETESQKMVRDIIEFKNKLSEDSGLSEFFQHQSNEFLEKLRGQYSKENYPTLRFTAIPEFDALAGGSGNREEPIDPELRQEITEKVIRFYLDIKKKYERAMRGSAARS